MRVGGSMINRTSSWYSASWFSPGWPWLMILLVSPEIYDAFAGSRRDLSDGWSMLGFLVAISVLLTLLALAVVRRWRWAFWLVLVAFFAGLLRVPAAALELTGTSRPLIPLVRHRPGRDRGRSSSSSPSRC